MTDGEYLFEEYTVSKLSLWAINIAHNYLFINYKTLFNQKPNIISKKWDFCQDII